MSVLGGRWLTECGDRTVAWDVRIMNREVGLGLIYAEKLTLA